MRPLGWLSTLLASIVISEMHSTGVKQLYFNRNICRIDGYKVNEEFVISIVSSRSFLMCVAECMKHTQCHSVIFDKTTHFCQMNNNTLVSLATSSCGSLVYLQIYQEADISSSCCSPFDSSYGLSTDVMIGSTAVTPSQEFILLPSVDISIYLGQSVSNIFKAMSECSGNGGRLVILDSLLKHNAVKDYLQNTAQNAKNAFIGLAKILKWKWNDGSDLDFSMWTNSPEHFKMCAVMDINASYEWNAVSCVAEQMYICELV